MKRSVLLSVLLAWQGCMPVHAEVQCTDKPECWPEGSAMHTGLMIVQQKKRVEAVLAREHGRLLKRVSESTSADGSSGTDSRLLEALKTQQAAWLNYKREECELIGSLTGAGGSWPSTHAVQCELNHLDQRLKRVRSALRCVERLQGDQRLLEQGNCLQQLAPLTNR